jgi:hypothetical protein
MILIIVTKNKDMIKKIISENALNDMMDVIVSATNRGFKEGEITKEDMEKFLGILRKVMWTWMNYKDEYLFYCAGDENKMNDYSYMCFFFESFAEQLHDIFAKMWGLDSYNVIYKRTRAAIEEVLNNPLTGVYPFKRIEDLINNKLTNEEDIKIKL